MQKLQQQANNLQRDRNTEQPPKLESIRQKIQAAQGENLSEYELNCSATVKSQTITQCRTNIDYHNTGTGRFL
jgi:hypothetical protein